jgi:hypothetical protein
MYTAEHMTILCEFRENYNIGWLYWYIVMINSELRKTLYCTGWSFYILWILLIKSKNYEFGWHYVLLTVWKRTEKLLMLSTVMHTVNELLETIMVDNSDYVFRGTIASFIIVSSAFYKRCFAYALILNELSSEPESTVLVLSNAWTWGAAETACQSIGMGCWGTAGPT